MTSREEYAHLWNRSQSDCNCPQQVVSTPSQVLTGLSLGLATREVVCNRCGQHLGEGSAVQVHAYRAAGAPRWSLTRCYCTACGPGAITTPTLGTTEALVMAQLAVVSLPDEQRHSLCLSSPTLLAFSPPTRGPTP
jgi:hypothetical protein